MMKSKYDSTCMGEGTQTVADTVHNISEDLMAIHVAAQLMCRQSEGRQTYPVAKSIVMISEQAIDKMKRFETKASKEKFGE